MSEPSSVFRFVSNLSDLGSKGNFLDGVFVPGRAGWDPPAGDVTGGA